MTKHYCKDWAPLHMVLQRSCQMFEKETWEVFSNWNHPIFAQCFRNISSHNACVRKVCRKTQDVIERYPDVSVSWRDLWRSEARGAFSGQSTQMYSYKPQKSLISDTLDFRPFHITLHNFSDIAADPISLLEGHSRITVRFFSEEEERNDWK